MIRRHVLHMVAGALVSGPLAACAGAAPREAEPKREVTGTLTFWGPGVYNFAEGVAAQALAEFQAKHLGLKVEYTPANDHSAEKLRVAAAGGQVPDVSSFNGNEPQGLALQGILASMEPFLKTSKVIKKPDLWPALVGEGSWKSELYGLSYPMAIWLMFYNTDRYARAGLDPSRPPRTWDELEAAIAKTSERDGPDIKTLGFDPFIGNGVGNLWLVPFWQLGGELLSKDGTRVTIANETGLRAWTWLKRIVDQQGGWAAIKAAEKGNKTRQMFAHGAMTTLYDANTVRVDPDVTASGTKFGYSTYPLPPGGKRVAFGGPNAFGICKEGKQRDGAWLLAEHLYSEDIDVRLADEKDRMPNRMSVARSDRFIKNDPFRKLSVDEMEGRKWLITAPGAGQMRSEIIDVAPDILERGMGIMEALNKAQTAIQTKLDEGLRAR